MIFDENRISKEDFLLDNNHGHNFLSDTQPMIEGFDISYGQPKRSIQKIAAGSTKPVNVDQDLLTFNRTICKNELSVTSTKRSENLRVKYMKRNCDMGVDTRADPELKDTARSFIRTRGKPIKKCKNNFIKYELPKKVTNSQDSTRPSEDESCTGKSSGKIEPAGPINLSQSSKIRKPSMLNMTVSDILKNDDISSENMLLTFFTMKMANEGYYKNACTDLMGLEDTTARIQKLRAAMKGSGRKTKQCDLLDYK
jgi:hypothetical protein